jgi:hypothetical protein
MDEAFVKIDLSKYSQLRASMFSAHTNSVLIARFQGEYRRGSEGNGDGLFMAAMIAAYAAILEPICLILDLRYFSYEWGNTVIRAINFFDEQGRDMEEKAKRVVIVATGPTFEALRGLEKLVKSGNRTYCEDLNEALSIAACEVEEYLK